MGDKTFITVALLYWAGWFIFLIWKMFPNSEGKSLRTVMRETAETNPISPYILWPIMIVIILIACLSWPFWVIRYPFKKNES